MYVDSEPPGAELQFNNTVLCYIFKNLFNNRPPSLLLTIINQDCDRAMAVSFPIKGYDTVVCVWPFLNESLHTGLRELQCTIGEARSPS